MACLVNQQLRLRYLHDVLMFEPQHAFFLLPFVHQPAADRAFQL